MYKKILYFDIAKIFYQSFLQLAFVEKIKFFVGCLILISGCMINIFVQIAFKEIVNNCSFLLVTSPMSSATLFLIAAYGIFWTINQIANTLSLFILDPILNILSKLVIVKSVVHTMQSPYDYFLTKDSKSLSSYFDIIFTSTASIFSNLIIYIIPSIIEMLITFFLFYYLYGFLYGFLLLALLLIFFFFIYVSIQSTRSTEAEYYKYLDLFHAKINQTISHIKIIKTYYSYSFEKKNIEMILSQFFQSSEKRNSALNKAQLMQTVSCGVVLLVITLLSYYNLIKNIIPMGDFVLINNYFIQFTIPITFLGYVFTEIYKHFIFLKKAFKIFALPQEKIVHVGSFSSSFSPSIEFKSVSLVIQNKKILKNISFIINAGEKVAFLGYSGSGKSTCFNLITRLFELNGGEVLINNQNIESINQASLYEKITLVDQTPYLFYGTIADNIRYNTKNVTDEQIVEVLIQLHLYEKIKNMEQGINTNIDSIDFSGGEKQRIALARGILRNTDIFLLDEITSALDPSIEFDVLEYLSKKFSDKTVLMITHRPKLAEKLDKIILIENGKVTGIGTHEQLSKESHLYQELIEE